MAMRDFALSSCACLALAAAACAAPDSSAPASPATRQQPQQPAAPTDMQAAASEQTAQAATATDAQAAPPAPEPAREEPVRDLEKLRKLKVRTGGPLPPRVLPSPPGQGPACSTDADCSNAGAGVPPACAAGDRPCRCVDGTCIAPSPALDPPVDPAPQPPEQR